MNEKRASKELISKALDKPLPRMSVDDFAQMFFFAVTASELAGFKTYRDVLIHQLVLKGCRGENRAVQELLDREMGKPKPTAEVPAAGRTGTYYDFLMSLVEEEKTAKPGGPAEVEPQKPETDILEDLM